MSRVRPSSPPASKHRQVYAAILRDIDAGIYKEGDRLPSEAQLVERFGHSRITITRAIRDLQLAGFVSRRVGSGTYVRRREGGAPRFSFGLLIPDLGQTDIFAAICRGMMGSPAASEHALVWGSVAATESEGGKRAAASNGARTGTHDEAARRGERALELCRHYVERRVDGVFFAPVEMRPAAGDVNHRIVQMLDDARIPVVLLDRPITPYPDSGHHDLVGIDNRRAGFVMTEHLLKAGARRITFVKRPNSASTVDARESGYREAMWRWRAPLDQIEGAVLDPRDAVAVRALLDEREPEAIVCANDRTAGELMHTLRRLSVRIPEGVRLVGIDDLEFSSLLPVPLTTLRQPTRELGEVALSVMLERVARPDLPARDTRLRCEVIVRESCGVVEAGV